jgi:uridine kinase
MTNFDNLVTHISNQYFQSDHHRSCLVAISGIDGSGKGYIAEKLTTALNSNQIKSITINLDSWHNLPRERFNLEQPAEFFYDHAFNFERLFNQLILPLQKNREIDLEIVLTGISGKPETYYYQFRNIDVIILEGIFLLKRSLQPFYDLKIWLECSWETALKRALKRNQEGETEQQLIKDYQNIYFPAQKLHQKLDNPQKNADLIYINDPNYLARKDHQESGF